MLNIKELALVRIKPSVGGVFAFATYPEWSYEYNFFVQVDGHVQGKTTAGTWMEVSTEMGSVIREKVKSLLAGSAEYLIGS